MHKVIHRIQSTAQLTSVKLQKTDGQLWSNIQQKKENLQFEWKIDNK